MSQELEHYLPFDGIEGDRKHGAYGLSEIIRTVLTTGVFPWPDAGFFVTAGGGWNVVLAPGRCVIEGRIGLCTLSTPLVVSPPNGLLDRVDRVVLRCNYEDRLIEAAVKAGSPASIPVAPELQRDEDAYEISIARIFVARNALSITQGNIADERPMQSVCGFVTQIAPLDTESLFVQYDAQHAEWWAKIVGRIEDFLAHIDIMTEEGENKVIADVAKLERDKEDKGIQLHDVVVPVEAWVADGTYGDYLYRADIEEIHILDTMVPEVIFDLPDVIGGNFAPVARTVEGAVYIFAHDIPLAPITIPHVYCARRYDWT